MNGANTINPKTRQTPWEETLEDALADATPAEVLVILDKIKMWTFGYCVTCGTWNNMQGGRAGCSCLHKGEWNEDP